MSPRLGAAVTALYEACNPGEVLSHSAWQAHRDNGFAFGPAEGVVLV
jgi:hypothetical protein